MLDDDDFDSEFEEKKTPLQRFGLPVGAAVFLVIAGASATYLLHGSSGPAPRPHNEPRITQVQLPPPPPPPPPPKTPPPEPKKAEETPRQREPTPQKAEAKPAPKAPSPPAAVTTSIQGNGPGSLAAGNGGGGDCIGAGCGSGDGTGGDNDAYYLNLLQSRLQDALKRDSRLAYAKFTATISYVLDAQGHVTGLTVLNFSGDADARAEMEKAVTAVTTGDTPVAAMVGKRFTYKITEYARG
jgi:outer membrane biosynthesis protein TonB